MNPELFQSNLMDRIIAAVQKRIPNVEPNGAIRLFNGFSEGCSDISLDQYGGTLVCHYFRSNENLDPKFFRALFQAIQNALPFLKTLLIKERFSRDPDRKRGCLLEGSTLDEVIWEWDVAYRIDLTLHQDCSFYLDSANLRRWLTENAAGKHVLNTFAYTGSLGMAALAGKAEKVVQTDLKAGYLQIFKETAAGNQVCPDRYEILTGDFFRVTASLRKQNRLFDMVILDPPYFSQTVSGTVNQERNWEGLVNKIRPLVAHEGKIVLINNALYLSGADFIQQLDALLQNGYLTIDETIPVPSEFFGGKLDLATLPADPAPFNHPTKMIVLNVIRKDARRR